MGRLYVAHFRDVGITLAQDLFSILPGVEKPIALHYVVISQNTDVSDAAEEGLTIGIVTGNTSPGSGGSALTAEPLNFGDAADDATVRSNDTTEVSVGTAVQKHSEVWNIRTPWIYLPTPETRIKSANALYLAVQLITAPADSITTSGTIIFEELA